MRLLILTPEFDGHGGGIITFYRALAPALRANGVELRVIEGSAYHASVDRASRLEEGICVETLESARLARWQARLPAFDAVPGLRRHLAAAWAMWEQADYGEGCDIVEACDWGLLFVPPAIQAARPLVVQCHGSVGQIAVHDPIAGAVSIRKQNFLMVGRRWNVDITEPWDFSDPQWRKKLVTLTRDRGILHGDTAIDYFVFRRDSTLTILPPFAVGRPRWDNYFLFRCRQLGYPLIDATTVVTAVQQNHDYAHVPKGTGNLWYGPEADANIKLLGDESRLFTLMDATHKLTESGLNKTTELQYSQRRRSVYLMLYPRQKVFVKAVFAVKAVLRRIGLEGLARL
jgi:hypothetical protein